MRYAADLHLHSRHSQAVSPEMTLENIALQARRKGIDVIGTGDCLQLDWLSDLRRHFVPAEPGWFALSPETDDQITASLPPSLRLPLRFVLSTEVSCVPPGRGRFEGIHLLLYFPSFETLLRLRERLAPFGDLREGRPELRLDARRLLGMVLDFGQDCLIAPAHVMNPYFSALGSQLGHRRLEEIFGDLSPHLLAVEMGLTSTPIMCRRVSSLDPFTLFACSDAHSLENLGRECTLLDTEAGYIPLFAALTRGAPDEILGAFKTPVVHARYYLNYCSRCQASFEDLHCPHCRRPLPVGSRDWLERIAARAMPAQPPPAFQMSPPLLALLKALGWKAKEAEVLRRRLLDRLGHERHILTEAGPDRIAEVSGPRLAAAIAARRRSNFPYSESLADEDPPAQLAFTLS